MRLFFFGPLDRSFVHKQKQENVFVKDLRRSIPKILDKATVEQMILPDLEDSLKITFKEYYSQDNSEGENYHLDKIPRILPGNLLDPTAGGGYFSQEQKVRMGKIYIPSPNKDYQELPADISPEDRQTLEGIFQGSGFSISIKEQIFISNLLEALPRFVPLEEFTAGFLVRADHKFFFEHPNEHLPGLKILEAGRQFSTACWHIFGQVPLTGYQFILNEFNSTFHDYVELHYPSEFTGRMISLEKGRDGIWSSGVMEVILSQRGTPRVTMTMKARVIPSRIFHRMRSSTTEPPSSHRFEPNPGIRVKAILWDLESERYISTELLDISSLGFRVKLLEEGHPDLSGRLMEVMLHFDDSGIIRANALCLWMERKSVGESCGFEFKSVRDADRKNLIAAIRTSCLLREERKITNL